MGGNNLRQLGIAATCNAGGANKWPRELASHLRGADVVLVPDNDDKLYGASSVRSSAWIPSIAGAGEGRKDF
jgi:hypothetical protein